MKLWWVLGCLYAIAFQGMALLKDHDWMFVTLDVLTIACFVFATYRAAVTKTERWCDPISPSRR